MLVNPTSKQFVQFFYYAKFQLCSVMVECCLDDALFIRSKSDCKFFTPFVSITVLKSLAKKLILNSNTILIVMQI